MQQPVQNFEFKSVGYLRGHTDWVTSIIASQDAVTKQDIIISASRDKSILIWKELEQQSNIVGANEIFGEPRKSLLGHAHFIQDLAISNENKFLISASWDHELRLWDLSSGTCIKRFVGNEKEVFSVAFSPDNRQIISGGAEKKLKLFNTLGELKFTQDKHNHSEWVSRIRFSPQKKNVGIEPYFVSAGWDGWLKVWNHNFSIRYSFKAHENHINAVDISPLSGNLIATGGKDKKLYIWDITDLKKPKYEYDAGATINCVAFHPLLPWVAAATENEIRLWQMSEDVKDRSPVCVLEHVVENKTHGKRKFGSTSLAFSPNGEKLFGGFTDGEISVWDIVQQKD